MSSKPFAPFAHQSERVFADYLDQHQLSYDREVVVTPGDVDFRITSGGSTVFCDVKVVETKPKLPAWSSLDWVQKSIRRDVQELRKKFGNKPTNPCVLVTMNYSPDLFTAYTVQVAMLGDVTAKIIVDPEPFEIQPALHDRKGNAAMNRNQHTGIAGILVFDPVCNSHCYLPNPYAEHPLPTSFFPGVRELPVSQGDPMTLFHDDGLEFLPVTALRR
jgi:hypothetical protein